MDRFAAVTRVGKGRRDRRYAARAKARCADEPGGEMIAKIRN